MKPETRGEHKEHWNSEIKKSAQKSFKVKVKTLYFISVIIKVLTSTKRKIHGVWRPQICLKTFKLIDF